MNDGDNQRQPTIPAEVSTEIQLTTLGLSRLGWVPPLAAVSFDQWVGILDAAMAVERASPFWVGDLVNYAMEQGKEFEERAFQAMPFKDQTLRNYAVIARLFPPAQRRGNLTIRHHAVVAKIARKDMAEAQRLLEEAEAQSLSAAEMHRGLALPALPALEGPKTAADQGSDWRDALLARAAELIGILRDETSEPQERDLCDEWAGDYAEKIAS